MSKRLLALRWNMDVPNFINPETRVTLLLAVDITCGILATLGVCSRLVESIMKRRTGADDWTILGAWVGQRPSCAKPLLTLSFAQAFTMASVVRHCIDTRIGVGYHIWDIRPEWIGEVLKVRDATLEWKFGC